MLRRILVGSVTTPGPPPLAAVGAAFFSQCLGEFLTRLQRIDPHPAVLDLGVLCGANIAFLGAQGCRVSVESLPSAAPLTAAPVAGVAGGTPAPPVPLSPLSHPPESFSGILAWDAISRMSFPEATAFVETLRRLLLSGGVILAYFPGPPGNAGGPVGRYRIISEDRVAIELTSERRLPQPSFQNREIYALFSRFDVVRLAHLKTGTREILVAKSRRPGRS